MKDPGGKSGRRAGGRPWYTGGVRFSCQPGCGACCTRHGEYDYVYLQGNDLEQLADFMGLTRTEFRRRHVAREDGWDLLLMTGPDCPFLDGFRCAVYPARPQQCRTFPFWRENLRSREGWEALRGFCPGIGVGEEHGIDAIRDKLAECGEEGG